MIPQETICAIATAQGGAIGIVRVSGANAIAATSAIFAPIHAEQQLNEREPYTLTFGRILNEKGEVIDEVLVSLFRAQHSYTGEDSTEISCHGSPYILQQVIQLLLQQGCRLAEPGEYTQRAFLNGKLDLSQAEAVADLIASTSKATHRLAINQMRGGFRRELTLLRDQLLHFTSWIELELDFGEEDVEFANRDELKQLATEIEQVIAGLAHSFKAGNVIKNGLPVAIIGETNSGKSTLLNRLLNEEKAIVSSLHGTTRDVIEDKINIGGITFRFIDTAGIRDAQDAVEAIGIERTFQQLDQADIILWIIDCEHANEQIDRLTPQILPRSEGKQLLLIFNKSELISEAEQLKLSKSAQPLLSPTTDYLFISAKENQGIDPLRNRLITAARLPEISQNDVVVTNLRHYEALTKALEAIRRVQTGLTNQQTGDLLSQDIRECIFFINNIAGEVTNDMILHHIFQHFCIGK
jgi:tRNA modification GTPase